MKIQLIPVYIGCLFIALSVIQIIIGLKNRAVSADETGIQFRVRRKLAVIYLITGIGLFGLYWLIP